MLSISPVSGNADVIDYYANLGEKENHDYYSEDGVRPGIWWGSGAKALGLEGDVLPEHFKNVLKGMSPDGEKKCVQNAGEESRRSAFDLTWSAPKSWSVAWSQANSDTREEFDRRAGLALERALEAFQDICGQTRRGHNGVTEEEAKLVGAIFAHDTARGLPGKVPDANKHFHVVIANLVVREDGTTGALDARPLFQKRMKMALGAMFRAELSKEMDAMGLKTFRPNKERSDEPVSWFELECVPQELIRAMSKRRNEIEKYLRQHGLSGAKASEKAALLTREVKGKFTQQELNAEWCKLGQEFGFTRKELEASIASGDRGIVDPEIVKRDVVTKSLKSIMSSQARFSEIELLERTAVEAQTRGIGIQEIRDAVRETLTNRQEVVRLREVDGLRQFTTREMLAIERRMLFSIQELNRKSTHSISLQDVQQVIKQNPTAREEQREAIRHMCSGTGDVSVVSGVAGSGKTFMLGVARAAWEKAGYQVLGTSLAAKASRGLEDGSGIKSVHIHKLLQEVEAGRLSIGQKTVLVIDEAGMVGTRQMDKLVHLVQSRGAKLVLVGDHRQLQAISAGAAFRVIGERVGAVELNQIIRQREAWARNMVHDLRDGKAENALSQLHMRGRLFIGDEREDAIEKLVEDWKKVAVERGELRGSVVFASTNLEVRELNRRLQEVRERAGELSVESLEVDGFNLHIGDRIMVTRNNRLLSLQNGQLGEATGIEGKVIRFRSDDGFQVEIDTNEFAHLTLGMAISTHKGQGVTVDNAFILGGDSMTDREMSYVQGSRAKESTRFYSDVLNGGEDIQELAEKMNRSRQKDMAIEHTLEVA